MAASMAAQAARKYRAAMKQAEACEAADYESGFGPHDYCDRKEHMASAIDTIRAGAVISASATKRSYRFADGSIIIVTPSGARVKRAG